MKTFLRCISLICIMIAIGKSSIAQTKKNTDAELSTAVITVIYPNAKPTDTLALSLSEISNGFRTIKAVCDKDHRFKFHLTFYGPIAYFVIMEGLKVNDSTMGNASTLLLKNNNFVEPDDDITLDIKGAKNRLRPISYNNIDISFSGLGSQKLELIHKADLLQSMVSYAYLINPDNSYKADNKVELYINTVDSLLLRNQGTMSDFAMRQIRTNNKYETEWKLIGLITPNYRPPNEDKRTITLNSYYDFLKKRLAYIDTIACIHSYDFGKFQFALINHQSFGSDKDHITDSIYYVIQKRYQGAIKDWLILQLFLNRGFDIQDYNTITSNAMRTIKNEKYRKLMSPFVNRMSALPAYDFTLHNTDGKIVHLHDYKGKLIFIDFWFTGCVNCAEYYREVLSPVEDQYHNNSNIVFLTINIDPSPKLWQNAIKSGKYTSDKVQNLYTDGLQATHPAIAHYNVKSYPQPMLIGKDQRLIAFSDSTLMSRSGLEKTIQKNLQ